MVGEEVLRDSAPGVRDGREPSLGPCNEGNGRREVVLVLPGNPGVAQFYGPFMLALRAALGPSVGLLCCGYAGHSLSTPVNGGPFSVHDQVEVVATTAARVLAAHPDAALHLVGHSIGAHIALTVADRLPQSNVATVAGLFPTVHRIADSPAARWLWPLLLPVVRHCVAAAGALLGCLPSQLRARAVRCCKPQLADDGAREFDGVIARMASYRVLLNVLHMAHTEFAAVGDVDRGLARRHAHHLVLYYGVVDKWVPPEHRDVLQEVLDAPLRPAAAAEGTRFPRVVMDGTGAPHAYVLTHSAAVGAAVAQLLRRPPF